MTRIRLADGHHVNVEVDGTGLPLVLLHGFTGSAGGWGRFAELLRERFTTVAVDLPGHGLSDAPAEIERYEMARAVDDAVAAVALAGFARAAWLGYSMGGRTALHVAAAQPQAVASLVLVGASAGLDCTEERLARRTADNALAARIEREGVPAFVRYWESLPLFATMRLLPERERAAVRAGRLANSATGLANSLRGMGTGAQEPLQHRLRELTMPALVLAGEFDPKFVAIGRELVEMMPASRFATVAGAGHAAHLEQPEAAAALVCEFLLNTTRSAP